ncbi:MAG: hypothetical protein AAFY08_15065 [Planctomycetota bacterium]
MIPVNLNESAAVAPNRPRGFMDEMRRRAARIEGDIAYYEPKVYGELRDKYAECRQHDPPARPPLPIPANLDPQHEAARARQGGCCGAPTE